MPHAFQAYLGNWMMNHFEILSVARSKVGIMILVLTQFFQNAGYSGFLLSRSHMSNKSFQIEHTQVFPIHFKE